MSLSDTKQDLHSILRNNPTKIHIQIFLQAAFAWVDESFKNTLGLVFVR